MCDGFCTFWSVHHTTRSTSLCVCSSRFIWDSQPETPQFLFCPPQSSKSAPASLTFLPTHSNFLSSVDHSDLQAHGKSTEFIAAAAGVLSSLSLSSPLCVTSCSFLGRRGGECIPQTGSHHHRSRVLQEVSFLTRRPDHYSKNKRHENIFVT